MIPTMGSRAKVVERLTKAIDNRSLVRIETSPRNAETFDGFVVALGSKWVLVARTGDGGFLDEGLVAVRRKDVVKARRRSSFEGRFARKQPEWPPAAPDGINLDSTASLIRHMSRISPLIGIEQERRFNSPMIWIGVVHGVRNGWLGLHEVRADASWRKHPSGYKLRQITKVTIADRYQIALAAVAGTTPRRRPATRG